MNNAITMSAQLESKYRSQAMLITAGISAIMVILMFLLKWGLPKIVPPEPELGVLVEMNIPDEEMLTSPVSGGGGGGNPVQSAGPAGAAGHLAGARRKRLSAHPIPLARRSSARS